MRVPSLGLNLTVDGFDFFVRNDPLTKSYEHTASSVCCTNRYLRNGTNFNRTFFLSRALITFGGGLFDEKRSIHMRKGCRSWILDVHRKRRRVTRALSAAVVSDCLSCAK